MSTVAEIKARLLEAGTPFSYVRGATSLAQVKDRPPGVLPVAYVLAARAVSAENGRATGRIRQRQERDIMVVIVAEDLGDADGDAVQDPLEALKDYVRAQLLGWAASDMVEPITHVSGEVAQAVAGCVWFEDVWSAPIFITEAS